MALNLELKSRIQSLSSAIAIARSLGARDLGLLVQTDTYFDVPSGRLKLREIRGVRTELIFYDRPSTAGRKGRWSSYLVYPVPDGRSFLSSLAARWPVRVVVRKRRRLFLYRSARIHLDAVQGLGTFIEFEVKPTNGREHAEALYRRLLTAFDIRRKDAIGGSYADLLRPLRRTG